MVKKMFSVNGKMKKAVQQSGVLILGRNYGLKVFFTEIFRNAYLKCYAPKASYDC